MILLSMRSGGWNRSSLDSNRKPNLSEGISKTSAIGDAGNVSKRLLATRCVKGLRGLQYSARLRELQLPSMQSHILRSTLITAYNFFHGNLKEFFDAPAVNHLRGHHFKVRQPRLQLARRQAAFAVRVVGPWNRLPPSVAEAPSLNAFKERLDSCWATIFPDLA